MKIKSLKENQSFILWSWYMVEVLSDSILVSATIWFSSIFFESFLARVEKLEFRHFFLVLIFVLKTDRCQFNLLLYLPILVKMIDFQSSLTLSFIHRFFVLFLPIWPILSCDLSLYFLFKLLLKLMVFLELWMFIMFILSQGLSVFFHQLFLSQQLMVWFIYIGNVTWVYSKFISFVGYCW